MRGRAGGETTAEGPVSVGVCAAAGHAVPRTEKPAALTIAIRHRRVIATILAHPHEKRSRVRSLLRSLAAQRKSGSRRRSTAKTLENRVTGGPVGLAL
jgi:hypothetical protein